LLGSSQIFLFSDNSRDIIHSGRLVRVRLDREVKFDELGEAADRRTRTQQLAEHPEVDHLHLQFCAAG